MRSNCCKHDTTDINRKTARTLFIEMCYVLSLQEFFVRLLSTISKGFHLFLFVEPFTRHGFKRWHSAERLNSAYEHCTVLYCSLFNELCWSVWRERQVECFSSLTSCAAAAVVLLLLSFAHSLKCSHLCAAAHCTAQPTRASGHVVSAHVTQQPTLRSASLHSNEVSALYCTLYSRDCKCAVNRSGTAAGDLLSHFHLFTSEFMYCVLGSSIVFRSECIHRSYYTLHLHLQYSMQTLCVCVCVCRDCPQDIMCARFSPDGSAIAVGLLDGSIRVRHFTWLHSNSLHFRALD